MAVFGYFRLCFKLCCSAITMTLVAVLAVAPCAAAQTAQDQNVRFVRVFSSAAALEDTRTPCQQMRDSILGSDNLEKERPALCDKVLDVLAGKAAPRIRDSEKPIGAGKIAVDSHSRVLVTEPLTSTIHIFDFAMRKYAAIHGDKGDHVLSPGALATDAEDNIYVTDLVRGRIAIFNRRGKFLKHIGTYDHEGLFEAPQAIAIDHATNRIFVVDTKRKFLVVLTTKGRIVAQVGKRGGGTGTAEFVRPTDVAIYNGEVFVVDAATNRMQVFDVSGRFRRQFELGQTASSQIRGMAFDSQGRLLVSILDWVEVLDRRGQLLFRFGQFGKNDAQFEKTGSLCTDARDRAYIIDSGNRRIEVFELLPPTVQNAQR